ncbi:acyl carrier protein [Streptomyces sp. NPDC006997]|uniref:acyl carrier protein n=1 Tax=Streptomyces sp. NPDC006997 TaxID=3155356 RepID=UPI0033E9EF71
MSADTALDTVDARLFDCVQVNLAVLADRWYGAGTHLRLGAELRFRPGDGPGGLPTVERSARDELTHSARALGLTVLECRTTRPGESVDPGPGRYVVADAFDLPWVPYHGRRHMEHGFLAETADDEGVVVVDAYHNETPWGSARPVRRRVSRAELAAAVPGPALVATLAPAAEPPRPVPARLDLADGETARRYVTAYADHPDRVAALDRLTLETWLLARSRALHLRYRQAAGSLVDAPGADAHVQAWRSLAEAVYLGSRRVRRGRAEAAEPYARLAELLRRDHEVFGTSPAPADTPSPAPRPVAPSAVLRDQVVATAAEVLQFEPSVLADGRPLADVPGFSSFRVVEIVERLERALALEFAADDLVPENLHHVDGICRIAQRAARSAAPALPLLPRPRSGEN